MNIRELNLMAKANLTLFQSKIVSLLMNGGYKTRAAILTELGVESNDRTIDVHIYNIRKRLSHIPNFAIKKVPCIGYAMEADCINSLKNIIGEKKSQEKILVTLLKDGLLKPYRELDRRKINEIKQGIEKIYEISLSPLTI